MPPRRHTRHKVTHVRRTQDDADEMIGQDSFLDVVTNIVGILILLVMVVGIRTSQSVKQASTDQTTTASTLRDERQQDLNEAYQAAATAERHVRDMIHRAVNIREESLIREQERALLSTMVAEAEYDIAARAQNSTPMTSEISTCAANEAKLNLCWTS